MRKDRRRRALPFRTLFVAQFNSLRAFFFAEAVFAEGFRQVLLPSWHLSCISISICARIIISSSGSVRVLLVISICILILVPGEVLV